MCQTPRGSGKILALPGSAVPRLSRVFGGRDPPVQSSPQCHPPGSPAAPTSSQTLLLSNTLKCRRVLAVPLDAVSGERPSEKAGLQAPRAGLGGSQCGNQGAGAGSLRGLWGVGVGPPPELSEAALRNLNPEGSPPLQTCSSPQARPQGGCFAEAPCLQSCRAERPEDLFLLSLPLRWPWNSGL